MQKIKPESGCVDITVPDTDFFHFFFLFLTLKIFRF
jgi:hypothetical protein